MQRIKGPYESIGTYFYDKLALLNPCNPDEKKKVQCIAAGKKDPAIKAAFRVARINTVAELRAFLFTYDQDVVEKQDLPNRIPPRYPRNNQQGEYRGKMQYRQDQRVEKRESTSAPYMKKEGKDKSHIQCYSCRRSDHYSNECPERKNQGKTKKVLSIGSSVGDDTRFVEAEVDGQPLRAYIDLGSQCVTLRESEARKLGLQCEVTDGIL